MNSVPGARMDIEQLKHFIAIAGEGSLSAASARLDVAQPSLSRHVIKMVKRKTWNVAA